MDESIADPVAVDAVVPPAAYLRHDKRGRNQTGKMRRSPHQCQLCGCTRLVPIAAAAGDADRCHRCGHVARVLSAEL